MSDPSSLTAKVNRINGQYCTALRPLHSVRETPGNVHKVNLGCIAAYKRRCRHCRGVCGLPADPGGDSQRDTECLDSSGYESVIVARDGTGDTRCNHQIRRRAMSPARTRFCRSHRRCHPMGGLHSGTRWTHEYLLRGVSLLHRRTKAET